MSRWWQDIIGVRRDLIWTALIFLAIGAATGVILLADQPQDKPDINVRVKSFFPEGTIPGEEDRMRHEVEPDTGMLRGHSGAVRMAIEGRVPIVPIGVSGTGASFPPEVYPRLEILEPPKPVVPWVLTMESFSISVNVMGS